MAVIGDTSKNLGSFPRLRPKPNKRLELFTCSHEGSCGQALFFRTEYELWEIFQLRRAPALFSSTIPRSDR
jgi:hypothetical protein